ncbi:unnamed protein product [Amoebophrya sp. A120]|nr:unnamed protein product [Amoebophrya sp. A120]|eukprot:GSA120T00006608001.1
MKNATMIFARTTTRSSKSPPRGPGRTSASAASTSRNGSDTENKEKNQSEGASTTASSNLKTMSSSGAVPSTGSTSAPSVMKITSETHKLPVTWLRNDEHMEHLGLSMAPGKKLPNGGRDSCVYDRDLFQDLQFLKSERNVKMVVNLLSRSELLSLGIKQDQYRKHCCDLGIVLLENLAVIEMAPFSDMEEVHRVCGAMAELRWGPGFLSKARAAASDDVLFSASSNSETELMPSDTEANKSTTASEETINRVLIHCRGGNGRTGTLAACFYLFVKAVVTKKLAKSKDAINFIRTFRPRAIESRKQEDCVVQFRDHLRLHGIAVPEGGVKDSALIVGRETVGSKLRASNKVVSSKAKRVLGEAKNEAETKNEQALLSGASAETETQREHAPLGERETGAEDLAIDRGSIPGVAPTETDEQSALLLKKLVEQQPEQEERFRVRSATIDLGAFAHDTDFSSAFATTTERVSTPSFTGVQKNRPLPSFLQGSSSSSTRPVSRGATARPTGLRKLPSKTQFSTTSPQKAAVTRTWPPGAATGRLSNHTGAASLSAATTSQSPVPAAPGQFKGMRGTRVKNYSTLSRPSSTPSLVGGVGLDLNLIPSAVTTPDLVEKKPTGVFRTTMLKAPASKIPSKSTSSTAIFSASASASAT